MRTARDIRITAAEYLKAEAASRDRNEFVDGRVYAMTGGTLDHNRVVRNLFRALDRLAEGGPCTVYLPDAKVQVAATRAYYYPDVIVSCEPENDAFVAPPPCLIVEVLSQSTESTDRREKLPAYQTIPSLQEYVLVDSRRSRVEVFRRSHDGWIFELLGPGDSLRTNCLEGSVPFETIYAGLSLPSRIAEDRPEYA